MCPCLARTTRLAMTKSMSFLNRHSVHQPQGASGHPPTPIRTLSSSTVNIMPVHVSYTSMAYSLHKEWKSNASQTAHAAVFLSHDLRSHPTQLCVSVAQGLNPRTQTKHRRQLVCTGINTQDRGLVHSAAIFRSISIHMH